MGKITVEVDYDSLYSVIVDELIQTRTSLLEDYVRGTSMVFDLDPEEDRKRLGEMIKAMELVVDWLSVPGTYTFDPLPEVEPVQPRDLGN